MCALNTAMQAEKRSSSAPIGLLAQGSCSNTSRHWLLCPRCGRGCGICQRWMSNRRALTCLSFIISIPECDVSCISLDKSNSGWWLTGWSALCVFSFARESSTVRAKLRTLFLVPPGTLIEDLHCIYRLQTVSGVCKSDSPSVYFCLFGCMPAD